MSEHKLSNKLSSRIEGRELVLERTFNAPRELVFKVFSEADHLTRWWGPEGWETETKSFEFKPQGVWHYCMRCVDKNQGDFYGMESCGLGTYQEIVPPEKIVYKDQFSDQDGNVAEGMPEILVSLTFVEEEGKTKVINRAQFVSSEALQKVVDMGVVQGTDSQYNCLDEYLSELQSK